MEQVFHISFNPVDGSDDDDDDDKDDDKEDEDLRLLRRDINDKEDDADFAELWKNHVKRAFVAYSVTEEIKIRQQFEFLLPLAADIYCSIIIASLWTPPGTVSCAPAWTAGGLQWEKASATHSKVDRAKSTGPKEVGNPKAGSGSSAFGYSIWPMEVGVVGWLNIGVGAKANL